jgi:hypothetical protein
MRWNATIKYTAEPFVPWRPGYYLPPHFTTILDGEGLPYLLELDFVTQDGPECRAVRFHARDDGESISARGIREIPLGEAIGESIGLAAAPVEERDGQLIVNLPAKSRTGEAFKLARERGVSDRKLREVAAIYRAAHEKPTQAVQRHPAFAPISYSTAARWVMEARRRGFLPPARPDKEES